MKTNGKHEVIARIARQSLVLTALLAIVLSAASISRAQSSATSPATQAVKPVAAQKAPALHAAKPPAKGQHEGITVHGHWIIEVKNPDGTRVSRQEFENALVQPGGAQELTQLLLGSSAPGGYRVILSNGTGVTGPCQTQSGNPSCYFVGSLISPAPASFGDQTSGCGTVVTITATGPCFPLSITPLSGATGFVLGGTAVSASTVPITDVYVTPLTCPAPTNPPTISTISPSTCAQGTTNANGGLTHAALQSPVQITAVGQSISVTVQISFQ